MRLERRRCRERSLFDVQIRNWFLWLKSICIRQHIFSFFENLIYMVFHKWMFSFVSINLFFRLECNGLIFMINQIKVFQLLINIFLYSHINQSLNSLPQTTWNFELIDIGFKVLIHSLNHRFLDGNRSRFLTLFK
jgi:hypothetical protein